MLSQWFPHDILVITDVDILSEPDLPGLIEQHPCKRVVVDISHNQMYDHEVNQYLRQYLCLTNAYTHWYDPAWPQAHYFPLWIHMMSNRAIWWFNPAQFDAPGAKTLPMMCLNRNPHPHRIKFLQQIDAILDDIVWSSATRPLPGDKKDEATGMCSIDIGVGHPMYGQCAVNIVTETVLNRPAMSEKCLKPFLARQIPVLVGAQGLNQFLSDLGLDLFDDLVPWRDWDHLQDNDARMSAVADFVCQWMNSGTVLRDYMTVVPRVARNKSYFHSEQFRSIALKRMPQYDHFKL